MQRSHLRSVLDVQSRQAQFQPYMFFQMQGEPSVNCGRASAREEIDEEWRRRMRGSNSMEQCMISPAIVTGRARSQIAPHSSRHNAHRKVSQIEIAWILCDKPGRCQEVLVAVFTNLQCDLVHLHIKTQVNISWTLPIRWGVNSNCHWRLRCSDVANSIATVPLRRMRCRSGL